MKMKIQGMNVKQYKETVHYQYLSPNLLSMQVNWVEVNLDENRNSHHVMKKIPETNQEGLYCDAKKNDLVLAFVFEYLHIEGHILICENKRTKCNHLCSYRHHSRISKCLTLSVPVVLLNSPNLSPYISLNKFEKILFLIFSSLLCLINSHYHYVLFFVLRKEKLGVDN